MRSLDFMHYYSLADLRFEIILQYLALSTKIKTNRPESIFTAMSFYGATYRDGEIVAALARHEPGLWNTHRNRYCHYTSTRG